MDDKVLKSDTLTDKIPLSSPKVLKREVYEASREARDVVALAQEKAKHIIEDAEAECDAIRQRAREEGIAKGLSEWNEILARANERAEELEKNWEESMLRLSVRVAEKIIGHELQLHPETIVSIVHEVLRGARPGKHLTIQVNDADAQQVRTRIDRLKESLSASTEIQIVGSAAVPHGGCTVESELGIIDARLETQLKCLEDVLVRGVSAT
jgi:type III secretion protein L